VKEELCERCGTTYVRFSAAHGKSKYCYECKVRVANDRINEWKRNHRKRRNIGQEAVR